MASTADLFILLKLKDEASKELSKIAGPSGLGGLEKALLGVGVAAAGAVVTGLGVAITKAMEFEKQMSSIKAVTGATAEEMQSMSKTALQLGKDTSFSALEAAQGIEELAKGGVSATDIMDGAAKAALNLAAAGGVPVAEAAALAANAMSLFNIEGKDMASVVDQIAGFANATTGSVSDMKFALAAVGGVAVTAGQDFDQVATALGVMGKAGKLGSDAGTSLKAMMLNLIPTTEKQSEAMRDLGLMTNEVGNNFLNADGSFKDLRDISEELHTATKDLTEGQKLLNLEMMFGSDGMIAATLLAEKGAEGFDEMAEAMGKVSAEAVAAERLNNLAGVLEQIGGSVETAAIQLGTAFLPVLKEAAEALLGFVNDSVIPFVEENAPAWEEAIASMSAALKDMAEDPLPKVRDLLKDMVATDLPETIRLFEALGSGPIGTVVSELQLLIQHYKDAAAATEETTRTTGILTAALPLHVQALEGAAKSLSGAGTAADALGEKIGELGPVFDALGTTVQAALASIGSAFSTLGTTISAELASIAADMSGKGALIGSNIVLGIANGITGGLPSIVQAAAGAAQRALDAAKERLGEHSWSKEGWKIGYWFSEGEAIGIDEGAYLVVEAAGNLQLGAMLKAAETLPQWTEFGREIPFDMALGIEENADAFYTAVSALANGVVEPQQRIVLTFEQLLEQIVGIAENHDYQLRLGSAGASLMAALDKAINDATPQNIQTVANMAFKMLDAIQKQFGKGDALAQELMTAIQQVILNNTPETVGALERVLEQVMRRGEHFAGIAGENVGSVFVKSIVGQIEGFLGGAMDRAMQVAMGAAGGGSRGGSRSGSSGGLMGSMQSGLRSIGIGGSGGGSLGGFSSGGSSSSRSGGGSTFPGMNTPSMRGGAGQRPPGVPGDFVYDSKTDTWKHPQYAQLVVNVNSPIGVNNLMQMVDQGIRAGQINSVPRGY